MIGSVVEKNKWSCTSATGKRDTRDQTDRKFCPGIYLPGNQREPGLY